MRYRGEARLVPNTTGPDPFDFCRGIKEYLAAGSGHCPGLMVSSLMGVIDEYVIFPDLLTSDEISSVPDLSFMQIVQVEKRLAQVALPDCQALDEILRADVRGPLAIQM